MRRFWTVVVIMVCTPICCAEAFTIATYNVELFHQHFLAEHLTSSPVAREPDGRAMLSDLRKKNDEDNWETAQVILDPNFNPDILAIEEGCAQEDLNSFNHKWLNDAYETVVQFPGNTTRHQYLELLMKKGFKILEKRDQYYLEVDPVGNERGERLFPRGPVFVKVQTPGGYVMWVGITHMKSKSPGSEDDSSSGPRNSGDRRARMVEMTKWRNREAARTHQIIKDLETSGPKDVILIGDMNDSLGLDEYEGEGGGDAISNLVGPDADGLVLETKTLAAAKQNSFHGYWRTRFRELIDHVIVTSSMMDKIKDVKIINDGLAKVSSDHFPVLVHIKTD